MQGRADGQPYRGSNHFAHLAAKTAHRFNIPDPIYVTMTTSLTPVRTVSWPLQRQYLVKPCPCGDPLMILSPQESRAAIALCCCLLATHALAEESAKFGEMMVESPVFDTADKRLQPEYATGFLLNSREIDGMNLQAGHFTAFKNQDSASGKGNFFGYGANTEAGGISFVGADLFTQSPVGGALYASELTDTWNQYYGNLHFKQSEVFLDANLYHTRDTGQALAGAIDNTAYSLSGRYTIGAHGFTLAYQKVDGDTPFDFVGGDSIYLANSIKYADFNGARERSWQVRYDLDLANVGIPGLKFMTRYVTGDQIDGTHAPQGGAYNPFDPATGSFAPQQGDGGKHWERDIDLRYVVQSGAAKGLSLQLSHVSHLSLIHI